MVSRKRHALKAISWRVVGTIDTMAIGWLVTGDPLIGLSIGAIEVITKLGLYYIHERAWYTLSDFGVEERRRDENIG
tara:strand:+ start:72 stop:302 length:231 start_codon:yes stop_codon:yes gene_type:complete